MAVHHSVVEGLPRLRARGARDECFWPVLQGRLETPQPKGLFLIRSCIVLTLARIPTCQGNYPHLYVYGCK
eukprot:1151572-Pelagomonas_calceolata.AAC.3